MEEINDLETTEEMKNTGGYGVLWFTLLMIALTTALTLWLMR